MIKFHRLNSAVFVTERGSERTGHARKQSEMIKEEQQDDFFSYKPESETGLDASFGNDIMKIIESLGEDSGDQFDLLLKSKIGECNKSEVDVPHEIIFPTIERNEIPEPARHINQSNQLKRKSTSLIDRQNGHSEKKTKRRKQIALWDEFPNQKDENAHFSWLKQCFVRIKRFSPDVAFKMNQKISLTKTGEYKKTSKSTVKAERDLKSTKRKKKQTEKLEKKNSKQSGNRQRDRKEKPKIVSRNSLPKKVEQSKEILAKLKKESSKKDKEKTKVDSNPTVKIKPILKRTQSVESKNIKKVSFCSKIFIRRFIPEDLEQS